MASYRQQMRILTIPADAYMNIPVDAYININEWLATGNK